MSRIVRAAASRKVEVRRLRRRQAETVLLRLDVDVEIPETSPQDVVRTAVTKDSTAVEREFFTHGGRWVAPVPGEIRGERIAAYFAGEIGGCRPVFAAACRQDGVEIPAANLPREPDEGVREIVADDAEAAVAAVRRAAGAHLIVGGRLWQPVPEPFWAVVRAPRDLPSVLAVHEAPKHAVAGFRLDRASDADSYAKALSRHLKRRYDGSPPQADLAAAPLSRDDRLHAALGLGRGVMDTLVKGWLRLMPRREILRWASLRDDLAAGIDGEAVARSAVGLIEAMAALDLNRNGIADRNAALSAMFAVTSRWTDYEGGTLTLPDLDETEDAALAAMGSP